MPALAIPTEDGPSLPQNPASSVDAAKSSLAQQLHGNPKELDISDEKVKLAQIPPEQLPSCPECGRLSRPGVVWFGESLPTVTLADVEDFIEKSDKIDLMIVVGTSAAVWPAAGYIYQAKEKGARVAVINMDPGTAEELDQDDWFFQGDAATIVPALFKEEIGDLEKHMMQVS